MRFMDGSSGGEEEGWGEDEDEGGNEGKEGDKREGEKRGEMRNRERRSRVGRWESGKGRCAITGRRVLGGTEGLRRVMV